MIEILHEPIYTIQVLASVGVFTVMQDLSHQRYEDGGSFMLFGYLEGLLEGSWELRHQTRAKVIKA